MRFKVTLIFLLLFSSLVALSQVRVSKSDVDYTLKIENDSIYRMLTFWKDKDSSIYSSVKYSISDFNSNATKKNLSDEVTTINKLWEIAADSINFNLESFNIGYPLQYTDILKNHIQAFLDSPDWQNHVNQNGKKLEYILQKKVMLESDVYEPLNNFLKTKGYSISGFETEKHGFVTKDNLKKVGFIGNEIIPMPFIVWIIIEKSH